jgi:hypothetical protein
VEGAAGEELFLLLKEEPVEVEVEVEEVHTSRRV